MRILNGVVVGDVARHTVANGDGVHRLTLLKRARFCFRVRNLSQPVEAAKANPEFTAFTTGGTESRIPGWLKEKLAGKTVTIIYDNTEQAQKAAERKAFDLASSNHVIKVKVVALPHAKKSEDLREWLARPSCDWRLLQTTIDSTEFHKV